MMIAGRAFLLALKSKYPTSVQLSGQGRCAPVGAVAAQLPLVATVKAAMSPTESMIADRVGL
jgi:hypothetical protein